MMSTSWLNILIFIAQEAPAVISFLEQFWNVIHNSSVERRTELRLGIHVAKDSGGAAAVSDFIQKTIAAGVQPASSQLPSSVFGT
jgi:hypothetical protein